MRVCRQAPKAKTPTPSQMKAKDKARIGVRDSPIRGRADLQGRRDELQKSHGAERQPARRPGEQGERNHGHWTRQQQKDGRDRAVAEVASAARLQMQHVYEGGDGPNRRIR